MYTRYSSSIPGTVQVQHVQSKYTRYSPGTTVLWSPLVAEVAGRVNRSPVFVVGQLGHLEGTVRYSTVEFGHLEGTVRYSTVQFGHLEGTVRYSTVQFGHLEGTDRYSTVQFRHLEGTVRYSTVQFVAWRVQ